MSPAKTREKPAAPASVHQRELQEKQERLDQEHASAKSSTEPKRPAETGTRAQPARMPS